MLDQLCRDHVWPCGLAYLQLLQALVQILFGKGPKGFRNDWVQRVLMWHLFVKTLPNMLRKVLVKNFGSLFCRVKFPVKIPDWFTEFTEGRPLRRSAFIIFREIVLCK